MKKYILSIIISCLCVNVALADIDYNEADVAVLRAIFEEAPFPNSTTTRGEIIGLPAVLPEDNSWIASISTAPNSILSWRNSGDLAGTLSAIHFPTDLSLGGSLDLSGFTRLLTIHSDNNRFTEIILPSTVRVFGVENNRIKLSSLPIWNENFALYEVGNQHIPAIDINAGSWDISSELFLVGEHTYVQITNGDVVLEKGIDYVIEEGIVLFVNPELLGETLICIMENVAFPTAQVFYTLNVLGLTTSLSQPSASDKSISVFPNPAQDIVNIEIAETENLVYPIEVSVISMNGSLVLQTTSNSPYIELNSSSWAVGSYLVIVKAGNQVHRQIIIKN